MNKKINLVPHIVEQFLDLYISQSCECCSHNEKDILYDMQINGRVITICKNCLEELHEEICQTLHKSVRLNDIVWELVYCDDNQWHIFPMIVKNICIHGAIRQIKGKEPMIWNIYAENDNAYMYKNFYDVGKTLFFTEEEAKAALTKLKQNKENKEGE